MEENKYNSISLREINDFYKSLPHHNRDILHDGGYESNETSFHLPTNLNIFSGTSIKILEKGYGYLYNIYNNNFIISIIILLIYY